MRLITLAWGATQIAADTAAARQRQVTDLVKTGQPLTALEAAGNRHFEVREMPA